MNQERSPRDQEIFVADKWTVGNTGRTKRKNYNEDFKMLYRIVHTDRRLVDKIKCPPKKRGEILINQGGREDTMGPPNDLFDPDPEEFFSSEDLFGSLKSIQSARKDIPSINIAYDCEYQSMVDDPKTRIILSYQFAIYITDADVLEVVFITVHPEVKNRLALRICLGAILDLLQYNYEYAVDKHAYAESRVYHRRMMSPYFSGSDEIYKIDRKFRSYEEAENYHPEGNPLVIVDTSKGIYKTNEFKQFSSLSTMITLVCHTGIVDLTAFKDDDFWFQKKHGSMLPNMKSVQGGLVSIYPYQTNVPSAKRYWEFYNVAVLFRDTMCYAPAGEKSLSALGKSVGIPKIELPLGAIGNMLSYMNDSFEDFLAYSAQDALVTLMYGSRIWGINTRWCLTATSGGAMVMRENIADYMDIPRYMHGRIIKSDFDRIYRGMHTVVKGMQSTPVGLRPVTAEEPISPEAGFLHNFAANSYAGGFNTCCIPGVYDGLITRDYDLKNAYPTAMALVPDIDFEDPIEKEFRDVDLKESDFSSPCDPLFCLIDFEFPTSVCYPCIAIHHEGSIIFPRKGTAVYASGPSLFLAIKMGAYVHVRYGFLARIKYNQDGSPSMSLRNACKQLILDRNMATKYYGKDSLEEKLLKLFVNGSYGKIAQNVIEKNTWNAWVEEMDTLGCSSITSPERASLITDLVRCMLIGTMNQLKERGLRTFSVTTDGFITVAGLEELVSCDAYGFRELFAESRVALTGDPTIWAEKHSQTVLINPTTRCNVGFGGEKCVLAHGGFITGEDKDSPADALKMATVILWRTGRVTYTSMEFLNLRTIIQDKCDFYTYTRASCMIQV